MKLVGKSELRQGFNQGRIRLIPEIFISTASAVFSSKHRILIVSSLFTGIDNKR